MDATTQATGDEQETREPVLDTVDRVSELCFGLFMALTFVGAVSAVTAGEDAGRKMLASALGCNLAWGLADAVMYLVRTLTNRARRLTLALTIQQEQNADVAVAALRDALPKALKTLIADSELEMIRARLAATPVLPARVHFVRDDFIGALAIFLIVVISTFPVALPFVVFDEVATALIVSRVLTLVMLFGAGFALGRFSGAGGMRAGLSMMTVGVVLTMAIIALGG